MLYGPPRSPMTPKKTVICGQAVIKDVDDLEYSPDLKLGSNETTVIPGQAQRDPGTSTSFGP